MLNFSELIAFHFLVRSLLEWRKNVGILKDINPIGTIPMRPFGTNWMFTNNSFEI
jgi:hypothetical protein